MEQTEKNVNQNLRNWSIEIIVFVVLFFKLLQGSHASRKNFEIQKTKVFFSHHAEIIWFSSTKFYRIVII